jgi:hypothetical protein
MRTLSTFTGLGWNAAAGYDAAYVWNMCPALNGGAPALSKLTTLATCFFPPLTPAFSAPVRREDGFTISVTNYDAAWGWTPSTSAGSVTVGTAAGSTLPIRHGDVKRSWTGTAAATRAGFPSSIGIRGCR